MRLNGRGSPTSRTTDWRYWRPYCREKPHVKRVGLNSRSTSTSPSAVDEIFWFRTRDGTAQPKAPVRASGLSSSRPSGRSPNPLPKNTEGVTVSNDSASTFLPPVPPTSQPTPTDSTVSCASLLKNWYFSESSRLSKPVTDFPPAGSIAFHVPPSESPRSGVSRLASSPLTSVSLRGSVSPVPGSLLWKTVGSESSSATNGSSTASVAGKKRLPARPWAHAGSVPAATDTAASRDTLSIVFMDSLSEMWSSGLQLDARGGWRASEAGAERTVGGSERTLLAEERRGEESLRLHCDRLGGRRVGVSGERGGRARCSRRVVGPVVSRVERGLERESQEDEHQPDERRCPGSKRRLDRRRLRALVGPGRSRCAEQARGEKRGDDEDAETHERHSTRTTPSAQRRFRLPVH